MERRRGGVDLRGYAAERTDAAASFVLVVGEIGFLKKGKKSVGVTYQCTSTTDNTANAQMSVLLTHASQKGAALVDRVLYPPKRDYECSVWRYQ